MRGQTGSFFSHNKCRSGAARAAVGRERKHMLKAVEERAATGCGRIRPIRPVKQGRAAALCSEDHSDHSPYCLISENP